jgi:hypothetical protein
MPSTSRVRALVPVLAAAAYLAFLVWQAPHTVHHFFEPEVEKQNECALSAAAERSSGTTVPSFSLAPVAALELSLAPAAPTLVSRLTTSVLGPRAPPASTA